MSWSINACKQKKGLSVWQALFGLIVKCMRLAGDLGIAQIVQHLLKLSARPEKDLPLFNVSTVYFFSSIACLAAYSDLSVGTVKIYR